MEKKLLAVLVALQAVLFGREVVITEADNGKTVEVDIKDRVQMHLSGNPTTGFTWEEQSPASVILRKTDQSYTPSSTLIGAGGEYTFTYEVVSVGSTQLSFMYVRPWETDVPPTKRFILTIIVRPAKNA